MKYREKKHFEIKSRKNVLYFAYCRGKTIEGEAFPICVLYVTKNRSKNTFLITPLLAVFFDRNRSFRCRKRREKKESARVCLLYEYKSWDPTLAPRKRITMSSIRAYRAFSGPKQQYGGGLHTAFIRFLFRNTCVHPKSAVFVINQWHKRIGVKPL